MKSANLIKRIYQMLSRKQKWNFMIIILIMIISAILSQLLPLSIGKLTDDLLNQENIVFQSILPFLLFSLILLIINFPLSIHYFMHP